MPWTGKGRSVRLIWVISLVVVPTCPQTIKVKWFGVFALCWKSIENFVEPLLQVVQPSRIIVKFVFQIVDFVFLEMAFLIDRGIIFTDWFFSYPVRYLRIAWILPVQAKMNAIKRQNRWKNPNHEIICNLKKIRTQP